MPAYILVQQSGRAGAIDLAHLTPDLRDHLLAFRYGSFELVCSLAPHAAQGELKNGKQLQRRVVKVLRNALPLGSANVFESGLVIRHLPDPPAPEGEYARRSLKVTDLVFGKTIV
jgi:hypothetical protein